MLRAKKPTFTNNTFDDPRGTVALEDHLIKNYSWLGIPVLDNGGNVKLIVSFIVPEPNVKIDKKIFSQQLLIKLSIIT